MKDNQRTFLENNHQYAHYYPDTYPNLGRCPFCSTAKPTLVLHYKLDKPETSISLGGEFTWAVYQCTSCSLPVSLVYSERHTMFDGFRHEYLVFPPIWSADQNIPEQAANYLNQAQATLNSPDASVVMSASAIDSMLKAKGLKDGNLYSRIDKAVDHGLLTKDMSHWAHLVRLNSNNPRHADADRPHMTPDEAKLSLDFAKALADIFFVLPSRIPAKAEDN